MPGMNAEPGRAEMKAIVGMFINAFPDLRVTIDELVAEGDIVVGFMTTTGTHQGEFMGIPATGKPFTMSEIHAVRIVDRLAVEHWGLADDMKMMQQLGVMPGP